ncbi:hypothetical protein LR948_04585 [Roseivivax sp. GX 12232]|uniref:YhdP family protein n=1 Tax=Roseivivax sp. GX 12232 TaxID=2900547 RepID=UPI001E48AD8E|nr:AsmA-like C-terminal region-containing protein [Roseivivax sp. GX 12232]MCE0504619.1 hypothetical protein [Roseivivax sp. GX 12232]
MGRVSGWSLGLILSVGAMAGLILYALLGRPIDAPGWLSERIETRLEEALPGFDLEFSALRLQLLSEGLVRVGLTDVRLRAEATGAEVASLGELRAGLSARALLSREIALEEAEASGLLLTMERDEAGALSLGLTLGQGGARPDLPTVIARIDEALGTPRLDGLDRVGIDGITLRYEDARARRGWTADGGTLVAERVAGALRLRGEIALLGGETGLGLVEIDAESDIGAQDVSFGLSLDTLASGDIATQSPALAWLEAIRAPISGDLRGYLDESGALGGLDVTLAIGEGALQPTPGATPVAFAGARTAFGYIPQTGQLRFTEISVDSAFGRAEAEGRVSLTEEGAFVGQFTLADLSTNPQDIFGAPLEIDRAEADMRLSLDPFRLELGRFRVVDPEMPLRASGRAEAGQDGWRVALDAEIAETTPGIVTTYWPARLAPQTRNWVLANVETGRLRDARIALRFAPDRAAPLRYIDLRFEEARVRFAETLPPVESAEGQLVIHGDRLAVMVDRGTAHPAEGGPIDLGGSTFVIADGSQKPATGELRLDTRSSVTALLSFLDADPMRVMQRANRPVALIDGEIAATGTLRLPLRSGIRLRDMQIDLTGTVANATSESLVPNRTLTAERLDVAVTETGLTVSGQAALSDVPLRSRFALPFGEAQGEPARVEAEVTLSDSAARAFGVTLPEGFLRGSGPGRFTLTLAPETPPRFELTSELAGLALSIPAINWGLSREATGRFELAGSLGERVSLEGLRLSGAGLQARGNVALSDEGGFQRLDLPEVSVGGWFDGAVTLSARGAGRPPAIAINGGTLDLRRAELGGSGGAVGGGGAPIPLSVSLDRLYVTEGIILRGLSGDFQVAGGLNGRFTSGLEGDGVRISGAAVPQNGGTAIRLESDNAGAVLEAAGLFRQVDDGTLDMTLVPVRGARGTYDGRLKVSDARLRDAPILGALLDAVSIVGIIDQLEGPGIYFSDVDAQFRLTPRQLVIERAAAVGPSMGISVDGYLDLANRRIDVQGVFSPIYFLNGVGQLLTRPGEGLFGFNFNVTGAMAEPRVAVNPLSVFTPGMFREIFRRPPPSPGN